MFSVVSANKEKKGRSISLIKQMKNPILILVSIFGIYLVKYFFTRNSYTGIPIRITNNTTCSGFSIVIKTCTTF